MADFGLTHIALTSSDLDRTAIFYREYANMEVVHQREGVIWISDRTRPFVIVFVKSEHLDSPLGPFSHLGYACKTLGEFNTQIDQARQAGILEREPTDSGPPVGIWAFIRDPDGHMLELSYGQDVEFSVEDSS